MIIEVFAFCDAAADYAGKLNVLGAFDGIFAGEAPVVQAHCAVALRLRIGKDEAGTHPLKFQLMDADGELVVPPLNADVNVEVPAEQESVAINVVINLQQLRFPHFGRYRLGLEIDGREMASLPVSVMKPNRPAAGHEN